MAYEGIALLVTFVATVTVPAVTLDRLETPVATIFNIKWRAHAQHCDFLPLLHTVLLHSSFRERIGLLER